MRGTRQQYDRLRSFVLPHVRHGRDFAGPASGPSNFCGELSHTFDASFLGGVAGSSRLDLVPRSVDWRAAGADSPRGQNNDLGAGPYNPTASPAGPSAYRDRSHVRVQSSPHNIATRFTGANATRTAAHTLPVKTPFASTACSLLPPLFRS